MKIAIIDLGTNTFNLLIAEIREDQPFQELLNTKSAVMLGKEGINEGILSDKAITRAYTVIRGFSQLIRDFNCEKTVAFGTSAIRSASNSGEFISKISEDFNIQIEKITGDQEAEFIYEGVSQSIQFTCDNFLIMDIGGGSIEFIIANEGGVLWKQSLMLGGARLLDMFKPTDPISQSGLEQITHYVKQELSVLREAIVKFPVTRLVGSSGAFDSYAEMIYYRKTGLALPKTTIRYFITILEFNQLYDILLKSNKKLREGMLGLDPVRIDTIVVAALLTKIVLGITKVSTIIQASYSLKEGVAVKLSKHM